MILTKDFRVAPPKSVYYIIFTISGFSGLIYESIWSHYLKLFLGHAAYAQSLVLAIFMGGMAAGAWLASHYSAKSRKPILIYAIVELIIGILALIFHGSFIAITDNVYHSILPGLDSIFLAHTVKWTIAALMIIPQSILLGMTFPLMTAGILRRYPEAPGKTISTLYFTNSIGAAIGVLASGFLLIGHIGLPGTIMTAGVINILLALAVWTLIQLDNIPNTPTIKAAKTGGISQSNKLLLTAAFITGLASFIYEISWIRMLSLVLGSSTHAFELMLSAFIAGLAFGGLWIRKRIDNIASPIQFSGYIQIIMGLLALLTIPLYTHTFDWMSHIITTLSRTDQGYTGLLLSSHAIVLAIMLPTTFCAGTTLPLFTHILLKTGYGEKSIGRVYAFNTIGAIIGVIFAVNIGLPYLGLKNLVSLGAGLDIILGIILLTYALGTKTKSSKLQIVASTASAIAIFTIVMATTSLNPRLLASGIYRIAVPVISTDSTIYFYKDGKTASIAVYGKKDDVITISTNGKPDASIQINKQKQATEDETTMILAAALPFGYKPDAKNVANIGLGSGQTTHTVLSLSQVENVDTIEIESSMIEGSKKFGEKVERAHTDPRSHIFTEDAKTFFSLNNTQYDIIISEPSNPWVSGTSSLFTDEFYAQVKNYLVDDGLLVQWIHLYESNIDLLISVLKAVNNNFSDFVVYESNSLDLIIITRKTGALGNFSANAILDSNLKNSLDSINVSTPADLYYRLVSNKNYLENLLDASGIPMNSDYFPYLDLNAHRAFFLKKTATDFTNRENSFPAFQILNKNHFDLSKKRLTKQSNWNFSMYNQAAKRSINAILQPDANHLSKLDLSMQNHIMTLSKISDFCNQEQYATLWIHNLQSFLPFLINHADPDDLLLLWQSPIFSNCYSIADNNLRSWMDFYKAVFSGNANEMATLGEQLLYQSAELDKNTRIYLLAATMLANNILMQYDTSMSIWRYAGGEYLPAAQTPFYLNIIAEDAFNDK